jgi:TolB protein
MKLNIALLSKLLKKGVWITAALATIHANAQLNIQVTKGSASAIPVAVVPFGSSFAVNQDTDVAGIIRNDLAKSGQIRSITNLPASPTSPSKVNVGQFRSAGADFVVVGTASQASGNYVAEFALVDTAKGTTLLQNRITVPSNQPRKLGHAISDLVYERLTGQKSSFASRLAYVQQSGSSYALVVADSDGFNPNFVLNSNEPILSPSWAPDGRRLAYVSYENRRPEIFVQDVFNGSRQVIANNSGVNTSPAWSPDGSRIAMTLSPNGNSEIYVYDVNSASINRITRNKAIDSEPAWSSDGSTIYFTSDRGGNPGIYRVSAGGGSASRVVGSAQSVDVSPRGDKIAYAAGGGSNMRLVVANTNGGGAKTIGNGPADDTPSFSPDGSLVVYAVRSGSGGHLVVASVDGKVQQKLSSSSGLVKDPAWSPK